MPKTIILTESDFIELVKRVIIESENEMDEASSPAQHAAIAINMKKKGIKPRLFFQADQQCPRKRVPLHLLRQQWHPMEKYYSIEFVPVCDVVPSLLSTIDKMN